MQLSTLSKDSLLRIKDHSLQYLKKIETEIMVDSTPEKIWSVLTNFKEYENWNPFMIKIIGDAKLGSKIQVQIQTIKGKQRTYNPIITKFDINKELRWKGKSLLPGIFDGERIFIIEKSIDNQVSFLHKEIFTGLGVKFVGDKLDEDLKESFDKMNMALKTRAENF
ncbi:MAG TPA: SRPBCC domain-containing protein [Nitrososphaeraceae archaeon]|nr:SRPBCC domain-containing protein [Nitrososphaeraceae archaeon]